MKRNEKEQLVFNFIKSEIQKNGYSPTIREICLGTDIKSTASVHSIIESLIIKGFIQKDQSKNRSIRLLDQPETDSIKPNANTRNDIVDIPLVGQVAAGTPILAEQHIEKTIPFPVTVAKETDFVLRVKGESMINAGIMDGDMILVEKVTSVKNGDIVVAMLDGFESEATVKTFYKEKDFIRLQPENDTMSPIYTKDAKILGKVKAVFRTMI